MGPKTIGQHITQFRETDSNKLVQQKIYPLFHLISIYTWAALLILYLANIWSQVRHICSNYFGFRNIKPSLEYFEKADASIMAYPRTSDKKCKSQNITEWGDAKSEPFGYLTQKSFSQHDRLDSK